MQRVVSQPPRARVALLAAGFALLAAFAAAVAYFAWFRAPRYESDARLLAELASATLADYPPADDLAAQWRGKARAGVFTVPRLLARWPERGPKLLWDTPGGGGWSSFAVAGERFYSMIGPLEDKEWVVCWNLADGKERWRHGIAVSAGHQYEGPRATPTVVGDRLYTAGSDGAVICLNTADGKPVWSRDVRQDLGGAPDQWRYAFSPLVEGGLVYVLAGGRGRSLAAFRASDGELAWAGESDPPAYSSPVAATLGGVRQVLFLTGTRLLGVQPADGKVLWATDWRERTYGVTAATPLVIHARGAGGEALDYVFISSGYGTGCALVKVTNDGGRFRARKVYTSSDLSLQFSSPVLHKDHLYGLDHGKDLTCLDWRTGQAVWRFDPGEGGTPLRRRAFQDGAILRVNDKLLVQSVTGKLALVACDPAGYRERAAFRGLGQAGGKCWAMPVFTADGRLLARDNRKVYCYDLRGE